MNNEELTKQITQYLDNVNNQCNNHEVKRLEHLRDQFAMAALTGLLTNHDLRYSKTENNNILHIAAYKHADAMLEARKAKDE